MSDLFAVIQARVTRSNLTSLFAANTKAPKTSSRCSLEARTRDFSVATALRRALPVNLEFCFEMAAVDSARIGHADEPELV